MSFLVHQHYVLLNPSLSHLNVPSCELPNPRLYSFEGAVVLSNSPDDAAHQLPLTADSLLLRGCTLRKTDWAVGVVVYTGNDSRIMRNKTPSPRKVGAWGGGRGAPGGSYAGDRAPMVGRAPTPMRRLSSGALDGGGCSKGFPK